MQKQNLTNRLTYSNAKGLSVIYKKEKVDKIINVIRENEDEIFKELKEDSIAKYCFIQEEILKGNIQKNLVFQFVYTSFYGMKVAGLTERFIEVYFSLMNKYYQEGNINIDDIVKLLYQEKNRKGQESLQFSFSSKLLHTLDNSFPIYDSEISFLFEFKRPYSSKDFSERMKTYKTQYEELKFTYETIISHKLLTNQIEIFKNKYKNYQVPDIKILDFLLWRAGKLLKQKTTK